MTDGHRRILERIRKDILAMPKHLWTSEIKDILKEANAILRRTDLVLIQGGKP